MWISFTSRQSRWVYPQSIQLAAALNCVSCPDGNTQYDLLSSFSPNSAYSSGAGDGNVSPSRLIMAKCGTEKFHMKFKKCGNDIFGTVVDLSAWMAFPRQCRFIIKTGFWFLRGKSIVCCKVIFSACEVKVSLCFRKSWMDGAVIVTGKWW